MFTNCKTADIRNVMDDSYAEYNEDSNKKDPKFKVGDHARISKYTRIMAKKISLHCRCQRSRQIIA